MKSFLKGTFSAAALMILLLVVTIPALAQAEMTLRVSKDFGYNNGSKIRGTFSLNVIGPEDLTSVVYLIDGQEVGRVDQAPFKLQIKTGDFTSSDHLLQARGTRADGSSIESPVRTFSFLSREEEASGMTKIIFPLLGAVLLITLGSFAIQMLNLRGGRSRVLETPGTFTYRSGFGAVCPRCQLPTPVHITGLNLGFMTKFDRCENCGKWGLMRVRPPREMEAYAYTLAVREKEHLQVVSETPEEKLRHQVDDFALHRLGF